MLTSRTHAYVSELVSSLCASRYAVVAASRPRLESPGCSDVVIYVLSAMASVWHDAVPGCELSL